MTRSARNLPVEQHSSLGLVHVDLQNGRHSPFDSVDFRRHYVVRGNRSLTNFGGIRAMSQDPKNLGFATRAIHAGQDADPPPARPSCPFMRRPRIPKLASGSTRLRVLAQRESTRTALETCLAALEGGERGLAFASGLAATTAVFATCSSRATKSRPRPISMAGPFGCSTAYSKAGD